MGKKTYIARPETVLLLQEALEELRLQGVEPPLDELFWLYELSKDCLPSPDNPPAFITPAIQCGSVWLYGPTVQAQLWLSEYVEGWWSGDAELYRIATAFALAHSSPDIPPYFFQRLSTRGWAWAAVRVWAWGNLNAEIRLVDWAIDRLLGIRRVTRVDDLDLLPEADPDTLVNGYGETIARLKTSFPDHTVRELLTMPEGVCLRMMEQSSIRMRRKKGTPGGAPPEPTNKRAVLTFRLALAHIAKKHKDPEAAKRDEEGPDNE